VGTPVIGGEGKKENPRSERPDRKFLAALSIYPSDRHRYAPDDH